MRAMIDGRVYDTDSAEEIIRFTRRVDRGPLFCGSGEHWMQDHELILYRTAKGAFFEYDAEDETIALTTRKAVRALMRELDPGAGGDPFLRWGA